MPFAVGGRNFRHLVERRSLEHKYLIDSCGTGHWHVGEPPHKNSLLVAKKHGVSLEGQRARQICSNDFQMFDLIVAMDRQNQEDLFSWSHNSNARIICLREFDSAADNHDVPDPYYGGLEGFQSVYEILHRSCLALLEDLEKSK